MYSKQTVKARERWSIALDWNTGQTESSFWVCQGDGFESSGYEVGSSEGSGYVNFKFTAGRDC